MSGIDITFDEFDLLDDDIKGRVVDCSEIKTRKLRVLAESVFDDPKYKDHLTLLLHKLHLSREEVIQAYIHYDVDVFAYGNEIYAPMVMRFALHLHNLLKHSWHQDGKRAVFEYIDQIKPETVVDVGFGVPTLYVQRAIENGGPSILLCDAFDSAFQFSQELLGQWNDKWSDVVAFQRTDMELGEYVGDFDVYIFQDSLEHVSNSAQYIESYISLSPKDAKFVFSLPIGQIIPVHSITWESHAEIVNWLQERGFCLLDSKVIPVNPEVDLFAEQFDFKFATFLGLCSKS